MSQRHPTPTPPPLLGREESDSDNDQVLPRSSPDQGIDVPKTPSRALSRSGTTTPRSGHARRTPRSTSRNATPGRGSVRRNPSTPYTLRAMQQVSAAATPVRHIRIETRRYTPGSDLRQLSRLLVKERDDFLNSRQTDSGPAAAAAASSSPNKSLGPAPIITPSDYQALANPSRLSDAAAQTSQTHTTTMSISELDQDQRRVSERMSEKFSNMPSDLFNDLAVPEAVVEDAPQFSDIANFNYENDYTSAFQGADYDGDDDDDDEDPDNDLILSDGEEYEYSLLQNKSLQTNFRPMSSSTTAGSNKSQPAQPSLKIPAGLLKNITRHALSQAVSADFSSFFKQKQLSKSMISELQIISDEFLTQQISDLEAFAKHGNRKMINASDATLLSKMHKSIDRGADHLKSIDPVLGKASSASELFCFAQEVCNLSELCEIQENLFKNDIMRSKSKKRKLDRT